MQMSAGAIPAIPVAFTSRTTTLMRAFAARAVPASLFGHTRNDNSAVAPSVGVPTEPLCGAKNEFATSGTPAVAGIAAAIIPSIATAVNNNFHLSGILDPPRRGPSPRPCSCPNTPRPPVPGDPRRPELNTADRTIKPCLPVDASNAQPGAREPQLRPMEPPELPLPPGSPLPSFGRGK